MSCPGSPPADSIPPLEPANYAWEQTSDFVWKRRALAGECMWIARPKEYREIFICSSVQLNTPISRCAFNAAAEKAWRRLRLRVPELAVSAAWEGPYGDQAYVRYQTPRESREIDDWVKRTSRFGQGCGVHDFKQMQKKVLKGKRGHDEDMAFLLCLADVRAADDMVQHLQVMLNVDHQVTDGIGTRILLGKYFSLLALSLSNSFCENEDSQSCYPNLSQPWIKIMKEEQLISGPHYEKTAASNRQMLGSMRHNPGLPLLQTSDPYPSQEMHFITLTKPEMDGVLNAIKEFLSPLSNITHLAHASMIIAMLRVHPSSVSVVSRMKSMMSPCWLNGRRYLSSTKQCFNPEIDYVPICQSFAPIFIQDTSELQISKTATKDELRKTLLRACEVTTGEYGKIRERKSVLPECVVLLEENARDFRHGTIQEPLNPTIATESTEQQKPKGKHQKSNSDANEDIMEHPMSKGGGAEPAPTADPFLISDGLSERYISHTYPPLPSSSSTITSSSSPALGVENVQFAAHAEKNLIVRLQSWRGRSTVSGEWRGCDYDKKMVVEFLEDLVGIMLSITENDGEKMV